MDANVAHPSVRVKGTEQTYTPVLCHDERCDSREKGVHMHCPLCPVAEAYQDPIILRAHFRIKHVDKGIDFAGLKVLRCCNHCEIVGTIKGEKRFKGAHWHCYRCRNGFNRKDEAIKHYKTHFRNPHTTFQIQIAQEVNCRRYYDQSPEAHPKAYGGLPVSTVNGGTTVSSVLTQPLLTSATSTETLLKDSTANNGISLGAEEEVGLSQNTQTQTLVLMDPDLKGENVVFEETTSIITEQGRDNVELNLLMQKHLLELHQHNETLQQEKEDMEWKLRAEIKQLKDQVTSLVRSNVKMFEELQLYRNPESSQDSVAKLLKKLESQHRELLLTQLASLRTELLCQEATLPLNGHTEVLQFGMHSENAGSELEGQGQVGGALAGLEIVELQLDSTEEDLREDLEGPESGKTEMLPGLDSPGSESDASPPGTAYSAAEHPEETPGQTPTTQLCMKRTAEVDVAETSESKVQRVS